MTRAKVAISSPQQITAEQCVHDVTLITCIYLLQLAVTHIEIMKEGHNCCVFLIRGITKMFKLEVSFYLVWPEMSYWAGKRLQRWRCRLLPGQKRFYNHSYRHLVVNAGLKHFCTGYRDDLYCQYFADTSHELGYHHADMQRIHCSLSCYTHDIQKIQQNITGTVCMSYHWLGWCELTQEAVYSAAVDVFISSSFLEVQQKFFINLCRSITRHQPTSHFVSITKLKAAVRKSPYNKNMDARMKKHCFHFFLQKEAAEWYRWKPCAGLWTGGPNKKPTAPSSGVSAVLHTCSYITNKSSSYNEASVCPKGRFPVCVKCLMFIWRHDLTELMVSQRPRRSLSNNFYLKLSAFAKNKQQSL